MALEPGSISLTWLKSLQGHTYSSFPGKSHSIKAQMLLGTIEAVCRERVGAERRVTGWVLGCCSLLVPGSLLLQSLKIHFAHGSLVCPVLVPQLLRLLAHLTCRHLLHCTLHQDFLRIQGRLTEKVHPLAHLLAGSYENCRTQGLLGWPHSSPGTICCHPWDLPL